MLTGYRDGDVDWRLFLAGDRGHGRSVEEREFIVAMRDFARAHGELIKLPAELQ
jgi:hypothetical protein